MYQRATGERQSQQATVRQAPHPDHYVANAVGKATLIPQVAPHLGPADRLAIGVDTAQRQVQAVRRVLLPALIKALRTKAKQADLVHAAIQLRHVLRCANEQVCDLEKAAIHRNPMLQFLRKEVDTLIARSCRLGVYHGREQLIPRGHEEPIKHSPPPIKRRLQPTAHKHGPVTARAVQSAKVTRVVKAHLAKDRAA